MEGHKIIYTPPRFVDLMKPNGFLLRDLACHACWMFYVLCEQNRRTVGKSTDDQIILEGQLWMDKQYESIAWSVCKMYGLKTPDDFWNYWPLVEQQAEALGYGKPAEEYRRRVRMII